MKSIFKVYILVLAFFALGTNLYASNNVNKTQCNNKGEEYIFAGGECIQYYISEGEVESEINIIVHGTWDAGTNTLGRYAPFADNISMATDITTIAISLPGYSDSSTNNFTALSHKGKKKLTTDKNYIEFLTQLIKKLKKVYNADKVNYIGHSAGAFIGSTVTGYSPGLIDTMTSVGAGYKSENGISLNDYIGTIDKNTEFLLVYGTKDKISKPQITKEYYNILNKKGYNVKIVEVVDAPHIDLDMSDTSVEAITEMLEEE